MNLELSTPQTTSRKLLAGWVQLDGDYKRNRSHVYPVQRKRQKNNHNVVVLHSVATTNTSTCIYCPPQVGRLNHANFTREVRIISAYLQHYAAMAIDVFSQLDRHNHHNKLSCPLHSSWDIVITMNHTYFPELSSRYHEEV